MEIVNVTTKEIKTFRMGDERVIFDEKTDTYRVLPRKTATYDTDESKKEKEEKVLQRGGAPPTSSAP